ncbi:MAG: hypothetical protein IJZ70_05695 [Bacteroidales bacterium]|nr:hypothetical protein [Bacteroidales bacterium]
MKRIILIMSLAACSLALSAQEQGYLTGSFETNDHFYFDDEKTGAITKDDRFGSNNYLKLDYYQGKFSAGMQIEGYLPSTVGYPTELSGINLSNIYASWKDDDFSVTAGTFYDQFGSGLLFRSWEDRALGLNNAIMGARFTYSYKDIVAFKALWGLPRFGMGVFTNNTKQPKTVTNTETQVRGADLSFVLSNLAGWNSVYLALEGSVLNRFEPVSVDLIDEGGKPSTFGWSGRANFESEGFFVKAEWVNAGDKYYSNPDPSDGNWYLKKKGNAQLIEAGYNGRGLGVTVTGRRLEWMDSKIITGNMSTSNMMNYIPAMCTQYTYMLTTHHPYNAQTGNIIGNFINSGEIGGQIDAFYNFRRGTAIGGRRGMKVHANFSTYYTIENEGTCNPGNLLFRDFSFDVERQWTKQFKMVLLYSLQQYNDSYGATPEYMTQNIFVSDLLYKWTPTFSTRLELQYLHTKQDKKDWMAALLEVNFAPHWSIFASDMYNHGSSKIHYYNAGVSYAKSRTRIALGYGRYKAGYICSGGVCRQIPAYTGANLSITTSF